MSQDSIPSAIAECTHAQVIEARFYMTNVQLQIVHAGNYVDGKYVDNPTIGGTVNMNAAKHGTFGKATPSGQLSMMIQNPHAFEVFKEAFERIGKTKMRSARFRVYFVEDEDQEPDH